MFSISSSALARLVAIPEVDTAVRPINAYSRLIADHDGDSALIVDVPNSNDCEFQHAGSPVLVIGEHLVGNHGDRGLAGN